MSLLEKIGAGEDRIEADQGRRRPRRLARRAAGLAAPSPVLAHAVPRGTAARPLPAQIARRAQGPDRRRQGGRRGPPPRRLPPSRRRISGRRLRLSPQPPRRFRRLSAQLRMASRPRRRRDPRAFVQACREDPPFVARRLCRRGRRAGLARRSLGPSHPVLVGLCALHPFQPRRGLSVPGPQHARPRRPPSRQGGRQGAARPEADRRLGGGDHGRAGRPGRPGPAQPRRGRADARARRRDARRWRARQPLAGRAARLGRDFEPASRRLYLRPPRRARADRRGAERRGRRLARGDDGGRGFVELAKRQYGLAPPPPRGGGGFRGSRPPAPPGARLGLSAAGGEGDDPGLRRRRRPAAPFRAAAPRPSPSN
jgi:hypothetical protein